MILAKQWPDEIDVTVTIAYLAAVGGAVLLGYAAMVVDYRRYLRSLKRALIVVGDYLPEWPTWARQPTPKCVAAFGLEMPCSEEDLLKAYRLLVKELHPDRGGDRRLFDRMQRNFEEALEYIRQNTPVAATELQQTGD